MSVRHVRLTKRGNFFYFRSAVPKDWQTVISAREIKLALGTADHHCAVLRSRSLSNAFDRFFRKEHLMRIASFPDIDEQIKRYFQKALNEAMEASYDLAADGSDISHEIELYKSSLKEWRASLAQKQLPALFNIEATEIADKLAGDGKRLDQDAKRYLAAMMLRAQIQATTYTLNELTGGEIPYQNQHPLFAGMMPTGFPELESETVVPSKDTISLAIDRYVAFKKKADWTSGTEKDVRRLLDFVSDVLGPDKPMSGLNTESVRHIRDLIAKVPKNGVKVAENADKSLSLLAAESDGTQPILSIKTQQKYFGHFRSFLSWALSEEIIEKMPGPGIKIAGAGKKSSKDDRLPYSGDQLKAIFESPIYRGSKSAGRRGEKGDYFIKDGVFFLPLIALYSGMRMGEIVQLEVSDIRQEKGIWIFDVRRDEEGAKIVKSDAGVRQIPIHKKLIEIGLLDRIGAASSPQERVFSDLPIAADKSPSRLFSKWWGRYSQKIGVHSPKTVFHSFRHNFADALREAAVSEAVAKALMGHSDTSVHNNYGSALSLSNLKANIDKVAYDISV